MAELKKFLMAPDHTPTIKMMIYNFIKLYKYINININIYMFLSFALSNFELTSKVSTQSRAQIKKTYPSK